MANNSNNETNFPKQSVAVHAPLKHNYCETECVGANPSKMNHKFNDKSRANVNRAAQLGLFEILTSPANHLMRSKHKGRFDFLSQLLLGEGMPRDSKPLEAGSPPSTTTSSTPSTPTSLTAITLTQAYELKPGAK